MYVFVIKRKGMRGKKGITSSVDEFFYFMQKKGSERDKRKTVCPVLGVLFPGERE